MLFTRITALLSTLLTVSLVLAEPIPIRPTDVQNFRNVRVGVFEDTPYHDEVIGGVLTIMQDMKANASLYRSALHRGFGDVIQQVWDSPPKDPNSFAKDIDDGEFDMIVLVTCDKKFWNYRPEVITAFSSRKDLHVVCLLHEVELFVHDELDSRSMVKVPAKEGRLTFMTLSPHSAASISKSMQGWMDNMNEKWGGVDVINIAPVFPISHRPKTPSLLPSKATILGRINYGREYYRIIEQLRQAINTEPHVWGYERVGDKFVPKEDPFTLNLIGLDEGILDIPIELENIVVKHSDSDYDRFYELIGEMDVILPAFAGENYVRHRASASIAAAVIAQVPVLADSKVLQAYKYLAEPAFIEQPDSLSEIEAIAKLRRQGMEEKSKPKSRRRLYHSPVRSWDSYLTQVRNENVDIMAGLVNRIRSN